MLRLKQIISLFSQIHEIINPDSEFYMQLNMTVEFLHTESGTLLYI